MNLYGIHPEEIDQYWSTIEPLVSRPIVRTGVDALFGSDYVLERIKRATMQCWVVHKNDRISAVVITTVDHLPKANLLTVVLAGAIDFEVDSWPDVIDHLKAFAKEIDCQIVRVPGREGWKRVLKPKSVRIEFDIEV